MKGNEQMRARYVNVSIHEDLAREIDKHLDEEKEGYRSRAEFISETIRLRLGIAKLKKE